MARLVLLTQWTVLDLEEEEDERTEKTPKSRLETIKVDTSNHSSSRS